jgi:hypothetical protein
MQTLRSALTLNIRLSGKNARKALRYAAADAETSMVELTRRILDDWLVAHGYLTPDGHARGPAAPLEPER